MSHDELINEIILDDRYDISTDGTILTLIAQNGKLGRFWRKIGWEVKLSHSKTKYMYFKYKGQNLSVHRTVYAKFKGELDINKVINHIDGNGLNNDISNLELVTYSENAKHSYQILKNKPVRGNKHITFEIAQEIRYLVKTGQKRQFIIAREYNLAKSTVSAIVNFKIWPI